LPVELSAIPRHGFLARLTEGPDVNKLGPASWWCSHELDGAKSLEFRTFLFRRGGDNEFLGDRVVGNHSRRWLLRGIAALKLVMSLGLI
jgi:hypothetical protein